jgi:hypothetical protein
MHYRLFHILLSFGLLCSSLYCKAQSCRPTGDLQWIVADSIAFREMPTYGTNDRIIGLFFQKESDYIQILDSNRYWQDIPIQPKKVNPKFTLLQSYSKHYSYFDLGPKEGAEDERNAFTRQLLNQKNDSYVNCILEYRLGRIKGCIEIDFSQSDGRYHRAFIQDSIVNTISQRSKLDLVILSLEEQNERLDEQRAVLWNRQMEIRKRLEEQRALHEKFPQKIAAQLSALSKLLDNINYMKQIALREGLASNTNRILEMTKDYAKQLEVLKTNPLASDIARPLGIYQNLIQQEHELHQAMHVLQQRIRDTKRRLGQAKKELEEVLELQTTLKAKLNQ